MDEERERRIVRIRVEAKPELVEGVADKISTMLEDNGFELIDQSVMHRNREDPGMARIYVVVR